MAVSQKAVQPVSRFAEATREAASPYLIGYEHLIDDICTAFLAGGHVLLIGLPGLGKTLLVKVLSSVWGLPFSRIQFTPDLLPSDITGTEILRETKGRAGSLSFEFRKGPVFANLVLADEINRTPPKTQSAMLQAMEEKTVTVGTEEYSLPLPFMVMATQNPIELEGTYPLPEAQLDRFFLSLELSYPSAENEKRIALLSPKNTEKLSKEKPVVKADTLMKWRDLIDEVALPDSVLESLIESVRNTRSDRTPGSRFADYGAGPRATQFLVRAARTRALLNGESIVTEEIVREIFKPVLRHRVRLNYNATAENISIDRFLDDCLVL